MYMPKGTQHFFRGGHFHDELLRRSDRPPQRYLAKVDHAVFFSGKIILRKLWNDGTYWAADMKDLEPKGEAPVTTCQHKDGLVCFG